MTLSSCDHRCASTACDPVSNGFHRGPHTTTAVIIIVVVISVVCDRHVLRARINQLWCSSTCVVVHRDDAGFCYIFLFPCRRRRPSNCAGKRQCERACNGIATVLCGWRVRVAVHTVRNCRLTPGGGRARASGREVRRRRGSGRRGRGGNGGQTILDFFNLFVLSFQSPRDWSVFVERIRL